MTSKVLAIVQHAQAFLNEAEMLELSAYLAKTYATPAPQPKPAKAKKIDALEQANWNLNSVTEMLLKTHFKSKYSGQNCH